MSDKRANVYQIRVCFQDTDAGGIVYHAAYINFAERARFKLWREGLYYQQKSDYNWVVVELSAKYIKPALLGDLITVISEVKKINNYSINLLQSVYVNNKLIQEMLLKLATIDKNLSPITIPINLKNKLQQFTSKEQ